MDEIDSIFARNENVVIAENAPAGFRPSASAWVISRRVVEDEFQAHAVGFPVNSVLFLIEFADGSAAEMPAAFLRHR